MKFFCMFENCTHETFIFDWHLKHIWNCHSFSPGFSVACPVSGCPVKFSSQRSIRTHIRTKHVSFYQQHLTHKSTLSLQSTSEQENLVCDFSDQNEEDNVDLYDDLNDSSDEDEIEDSNDFGNVEHMMSMVDFETNIADILIELREKFGVTHAAVAHVCEKMVSLLTQEQEMRACKVRDTLKRKNVDVDSEIEFVLNYESPYLHPLQKFSNMTTLNNFIKMKENYVAPLEVKLDDDGNDKMYYIPVANTLKQLLSHDDVFGEVFEYNLVEKDEDLVTDYCDGTVFKQNEIYKRQKNALQIILYHDDFTISNPIGNKVRNNKISSFYFMLGNLKPEHRSRLKDIHLLILTNSKYVSKYGYPVLLKGLLRDLKKL